MRPPNFRVSHAKGQAGHGLEREFRRSPQAPSPCNPPPPRFARQGGQAGHGLEREFRRSPQALPPLHSPRTHRHARSLTRAHSSIGQSPRLITGLFLVRVQVGLPLPTSNGHRATSSQEPPAPSSCGPPTSASRTPRGRRGMASNASSAGAPKRLPHATPHLRVSHAKGGRRGMASNASSAGAPKPFLTKPTDEDTKHARAHPLRGCLSGRGHAPPAPLARTRASYP